MSYTTPNQQRDRETIELYLSRQRNTPKIFFIFGILCVPFVLTMIQSTLALDKIGYFDLATESSLYIESYVRTQ